MNNKNYRSDCDDRWVTDVTHSALSSDAKLVALVAQMGGLNKIFKKDCINLTMEAVRGQIYKDMEAGPGVHKIN